MGINNNIKNRRAFTLVEIMIAAICMTIILGPIFTLLRSGSDTSLKGMMRIDTTLKARNIMQQVYADLKTACFRLPYDSEYSFDDILTSDGIAPNVTYSFCNYPLHEKYSDIFESPTSGENLRNVSSITYRIEDGDDPNLPFKKLIREEIFKGVIKTKVLSENVNFFEIKPLLISADEKDNYYFLITLQLIDVLHAQDIKDKKTGEKLTENQKDVILADFYDVVYPEFFHDIWNDKGCNPNWHTYIK